ncbi:MAG: effector binding domain-containing protein [Coprobacillaceae bacterium]
MNYIESLQQAITYMEEHILEPITYHDVASHVYMSSYHFHRTFSLITSISVKEYIRNRRLSLAGQELLDSNIKVLDMALKYGYETPESFTKAYTRFHGITPKMTKHYGQYLMMYDPLVISINIQGGKKMEYRIEEREAISLLVKKEKFKNEIVEDEDNTDISDFWDQCIQDGVIKTLFTYSATSETYGVCAPLERDKEHFEYGIGVTYNNEIIPEGYDIWVLKPSLWAVFPCIDKEDISIVWKKIFNEFIPNSHYEVANETDFEYYPNDDSDIFCEIWLPITSDHI